MLHNASMSNNFDMDTKIEKGSKEYFDFQKSIIKKRSLLRRNYDYWYSLFVNDLESNSRKITGIALELGSGGSYFKEILPELITSDVIEGVAEYCIDARNIPFEDNSVKALFLSHLI